jgi:hypothetical protein
MTRHNFGNFKNESPFVGEQKKQQKKQKKQKK